MDLSKFYVFFALCQKNKLKFDQDFKACWSFCFELKVLNESKFSMPWPLCLWQCIKTNRETKIFETGIETLYETKSFKSNTCTSLENELSVFTTLTTITRSNPPHPHPAEAIAKVRK